MLVTADIDTQQLVLQAQSGDRAAFESLEARYRDAVRTAIAKRAASIDRLDQEALVNEVWFQAWRSLRRFEWQGEDAFLRWVYGIARNVELTAARRTRVVLSLDDGVRDPSSADTSPSRAMRREERFERLREAIERLPPHYREVVRLSRLEGITSLQVAEKVGKSPEAVRHILVRALLLLRTAVGETASLSLPSSRRLSPEEDDDVE